MEHDQRFLLRKFLQPMPNTGRAVQEMSRFFKLAAFFLVSLLLGLDQAMAVDPGVQVVKPTLLRYVGQINVSVLCAGSTTSIDFSECIATKNPAKFGEEVQKIESQLINSCPGTAPSQPWSVMCTSYSPIFDPRVWHVGNPAETCKPPTDPVVRDNICSYTDSGGTTSYGSYTPIRGVTCPAGYTKHYKNPPTSQEFDCYIREYDCCTINNPVSPFTGAKIQEEVDFKIDDELKFSRFYNSQGYPVIGDSGFSEPQDTDYWRSNFDQRLIFNTGSTTVFAIIEYPNGRRRHFWSTGLEMFNSDGAASVLTQVAGIGWDVKLPNADVERYDNNGRLISIMKRDGRQILLNYNSSGLLVSVQDNFGKAVSLTYENGNLKTVTDPNGGIYVYEFSDTNQLVSVTGPDNVGRTYQYSDSTYPWLLTGIVDEAGNQYATYQYSGDGQVAHSEHALGTDAYSYSYTGTGTDSRTTTVTDSLGHVTTYTMGVQGGNFVRTGLIKITSISGGKCAECGDAASMSYTLYADPYMKTDFNGNRTLYTYDLSRHFETSRIEAYGTALARTITTQWSANYRLPTLISVYVGGSASGTPKETTSFTYDGAGNQLTRIIADPASNASRTWTYTYNNFGQVLTSDGPRTDVSDITTYIYYNCVTGYQCGQVQSITNALGQTTTYSTYNAAGQPLTIIDANGVTTTLTYDARQRLTSRNVAGEITSFEYWPTGLLKRGTLPDGSFISYTYDNAHRLTGIADSEGNYIVYTLDAAGNRTQEQVFDATNNLVRTRGRIFDNLSRLTQELGAANQSTSYNYDNNGNLLSITDPANRATQYQYDQLNRLAVMIDPALQNTAYGYDVKDNLISVTDPKTLTTNYVYNGLGDLTQLSSPDTGVSQYTHDVGGDLNLATDARGKVGDFSHDALGRVTQIQYSDQTQTFTYDQGTNGQGRLTQVADASGNTQWGYDALGRVEGKTQTTGSQTKTIGYGYTNGQLTSLTTPSGQTVSYGYANGKVSSISVNGQPVLNNVLYGPFGPSRGWTWGNGTLTVREYDQDGQLITIDSAGLSSYSYHPDGAVATVTHESSAILALPIGNANLTTSATSNRLNSATGTLARTYSYDASGNTQSDGNKIFTYNDAGRMVSATYLGVTATYAYNALGQRVSKTYAGETTLFVYDISGRLLGEYDQSGALIQEIVWLNDIPVATIRTDQGGSGVGVFYIHTDNLNAPSKITRPSDNAMIWRWDHDPYGNGTPNQDPDGNGLQLTMNLRFPGQYADQETGLYYNWNRYYDPQSGRYITSDPIGLDGGTNTYAYAMLNPISLTDPMGLLIWRNQTNVAYDFSANNRYRAIPGAPSSMVSPNAAGTTLVDWQISPRCVCSRNGARFEEFTVTFMTNVHIKPGLGDSMTAWARRGEGDHVADFANWADRRGRKIAGQRETSYKQYEFSSVEECESATERGLDSALQNGGLIDVLFESSRTWDRSGRHTYGSPNQRP